MTAPITDFTRLAATLEALSSAAEKGDWEQMSTLQTQQEQLLETIRQRPRAPQDRSQTAALAALIERALASIRAAQPHIDTLRQHTKNEMAGTNNHRKLSQSYR
ncbi:flagellar protein FliT [Denitromonas ohlonensis]|uniref:Flagellar protein FliT n=2 Tax=Denitromonas TaxID=139331 RepID=A0A557R452_9RHOO|nr:flagellar protein FliT [Denitromonas ohlonensis]TVO59904.1 flagellar protein FliT [Denitromonas ohlonensis]TVO71159.1 flagellar protein FliT [Denitromonas ohlonensis]TVT48326.1 MAG: flagellar protein FliT [Denitromonas halophila]TVT67565.1 MAG: flagellar protein FliT [Denitromonas halophila]